MDSFLSKDFGALAAFSLSSGAHREESKERFSSVTAWGKQIERGKQISRQVSAELTRSITNALS